MRRRITISSFIIAILLILGSTLYTLPYYVTKPGMAEELDPLVKVEGGYHAKGDFMLTTVRMGQANIYTYLLAKWSKYQELYPIKEIREQGESDQEFNFRQLNMMENSQESAIEVAFNKAKKPVKTHFRGIYVLGVKKNMPADGELLPGDRVIEINHHHFQSSKEFIDYVGKRQTGEQVTITFQRKGKVYEKKLKLARLPGQNGRVGIGIVLVDDKDVTSIPSVSINSDDIGGPSAGLMFSLEIFNQLNKEDITKGYKIAGTGEIFPDGTVGPIGGIEQKIVAADKAGAEIFFAPNERGIKDSNYHAAVKTAKDIGTSMKIVPVDSFDDAIKYLKTLKDKK